MARNRFYHRVRIAILVAIVVAYVGGAIAIIAFKIPLFPKPDGDVEKQSAQ